MRWWRTVLVVAGVLAAMSGCASKEKCTATITYTLEPTQKLPAGLSTVAVNEPQVDAQEAGTEDADRARKWSRMSADMIENMVLTSNQKYKSGLTVAKRRETADVAKEADLSAAGLTQGGGSGQPMQLADVQGLIKSKLNIRNEVKTGKQRTVSAMDVAAWGGHHWGGGSASIDTEEVETVARNLTVQCSFSLYDKAGNAIIQYSPDPFRKFDKEKGSFFMGSSKTEANLDSADGIIGELVQQGTREFVSMFVPCEVTYKYDLESGSSEASGNGIRQLRGGFYEPAIANLREAVAKNGDDHKSQFALGVAYELTGQSDAAVTPPRLPATARGLDPEDAEKYTAAAKRLSDHKDRIRKSAK